MKHDTIDSISKSYSNSQRHSNTEMRNGQSVEYDELHMFYSVRKHVKQFQLVGIQICGNKRENMFFHCSSIYIGHPFQHELITNLQDWLIITSTSYYHYLSSILVRLIITSTSYYHTIFLQLLLGLSSLQRLIITLPFFNSCYLPAV